jgi:NRAMP (natural resistance-associated macrophage protein)-like metal ion transporter
MPKPKSTKNIAKKQAVSKQPHSNSEKKPNGIRHFFQILGPGLVTGASDDDPSGIATYAMAGASLGYSTLWTALVTFPLMAGVQLICARIGLVYGSGLGAAIRRHYSPWIAIPAVVALVIANTLNAAADMSAIAAGINLLIPIPILYMILPIGLLILVVQIWGSYNLIAKIFKWLTLALFAYIGAAFLAHPNWGEVLKGTFVPSLRLDSSSIAILVAILGTTISPYLFFWQANHEVDDEIAHGKKELSQRKGATNVELKDAAWDVNAGMLLSNVVMYFIIFATAATLHQSGKTEVESATDAALALRPLAGEAAFLLMAFALIGSGMLAVPILTGSGAYAVAETFGWKCGMDEKPGRAKEFYLVIAASTIVALGIDYLGINPMKALFWVAIINGFLAPPLLVIIMFVANSKDVMKNRTNGPVLNLLGWATTLLMFAAAVALIWTWGST